MIFTRKNFALAATALVVSAAGGFAGIGEAQAGRGGGSQIYQQTYQFKQPMDGYEGFATPRKYCTYKRFPQRKCFDGPAGRKCKIVGWELEQTCY